MNISHIRWIYLTITALTCFAFDTFCQDSIPITNETVQYHIIRIPRQLGGKHKAIPSRHLIKVDIPGVEKSRLKRWGRKQWLAFLSNEEYDWAANLLLYDLFEREAIIYTEIKDRAFWLKKTKEEEVTFWSTFLKE